MKVGTILTLFAAGSVPVLGAVGVSWLKESDVGRVLGGEDLSQVAQDVASREFSPDVGLRLVGATASRTVQGSWGGDIRAEPEKEYRHVQIALSNRGRLDVSVHAYHFTALDATRGKYKAELGLAPEDMFEANRVSNGQTATGVVVFDVPRDAKIARILWQGELANATLDLAGPPSG